MNHPVDSAYVATSNVDNTHLPTRPLIRVIGETDDNAAPASTMQVADALIRAGKNFEIIIRIQGISRRRSNCYN